MNVYPSLPEHYLGVWQRLSLQCTHTTDTTTRVYWIQTPVLHADIRIPLHRPAFSDRRSLRDFSHRELLQLARQQGFAGVTSVRGECCEWHRHLDYQPQTGNRDIGSMTFNNDHIIEEGIFSEYREIWKRLPDSVGSTHAYRFLEERASNAGMPPRKGCLLIAGDYFMLVRDRSPMLPRAHSLYTLLENENIPIESLIEMMDFEISFGRKAGGAVPWEIVLSTLPFREGKPLFNEREWRRISGSTGIYVQRSKIRDATIIRHWIA